MQKYDTLTPEKPHIRVWVIADKWIRDFNKRKPELSIDLLEKACCEVLSIEDLSLSTRLILLEGTAARASIAWNEIAIAQELLIQHQDGDTNGTESFGILQERYRSLMSTAYALISTLQKV